ncbi:hypothetical protein OKW37_003151 [Paraburkholderia sp. MM5482-R2]
MSLLEACEESLNRFLGLHPRMAPDHRDYLVAHAYCALHGFADELKFVEDMGARTAGCVRTRVGGGPARQTSCAPIWRWANTALV